MHILSLSYVQLATKLGQDLGFRKRIIDLIDQRQWVIWERRDEVTGLEIREFSSVEGHSNPPRGKGLQHMLCCQSEFEIRPSPKSTWNNGK